MTNIPSTDDDRPATDPRPRRGIRRVLAAAAVAAVLATGIGALGGGSPGGRAEPAVESAASSGAGAGPATTGSTRAATAAEQVGVVDVDTVLDYGTGRAAGTGLVLTSGGEILTNNHVVQDSTSITVTVVAGGATYPASVVGTDATDDLAVLSLAGASGLTPAVLADPAAQTAVTTGTAVTAVGNAGGTGGTPTAATGSVTALDQDITASDETGADAETLSGLIEVSAAIEAGDSGGPLYADGRVIGIDTAASTAAPAFRAAARRTGSAPTTGYAIPVGTALAIAQRITSGEDGATVAQGNPAFLGVALSSEPARHAGGVAIAGAVSGSPAASAGLADGDVVTAIGGTAVTSSAQLSTAVGSRNPGDPVTITWTDTGGATHTATVVLAAGPAR